MLPRRCILCCDTSITRSWHGQCVNSSALKAAPSWRAGSLKGSLRCGRISLSTGKTVWSACLPDGSRVRRESHARFCERPVVQSHRPTHPTVMRSIFAPVLISGPQHYPPRVSSTDTLRVPLPSPLSRDKSGAAVPRGFVSLDLYSSFARRSPPEAPPAAQDCALEDRLCGRQIHHRRPAWALR